MSNLEMFNAHIIACGCVGHAYCAENIGRGMFPTYDVLHPETRDIVWPAGLWLTLEDFEKLAREVGIDYVIGA